MLTIPLVAAAAGVEVATLSMPHILGFIPTFGVTAAAMAIACDAIERRQVDEHGRSDDSTETES